jgi:hypothetical protein
MRVEALPPPAGITSLPSLDVRHRRWLQAPFYGLRGILECLLRPLPELQAISALAARPTLSNAALVLRHGQPPHVPHGLLIEHARRRFPGDLREPRQPLRDTPDPLCDGFGLVLLECQGTRRVEHPRLLEGFAHQLDVLAVARAVALPFPAAEEAISTRLDHEVPGGARVDVPFDRKDPLERLSPFRHPVLKLQGLRGPRDLQDFHVPPLAVELVGSRHAGADRLRGEGGQKELVDAHGLRVQSSEGAAARGAPVRVPVHSSRQGFLPVGYADRSERAAALGVPVGAVQDGGPPFPKPLGPDERRPVHHALDQALGLETGGIVDALPAHLEKEKGGSGPDEEVTR